MALGYEISLLITVTKKQAKKQQVAGYYDLRHFSKLNKIPFYRAQTYSLKGDLDRKKLKNLPIDVLLVIGWQRLIPPWLLEHLTIGAFGMHGSSQALPYGRGRSPLNWSLVQNKTQFVTNLFRYDAGVDSGDIVATQVFDLNPFDTARTVHYKNTLSMIKLLKEHLPALLDSKVTLKKQLSTIPTYYPKRTAEDGVIFWDKSTIEVHNLIRAVSKPFSGAFTYLHKQKITIWRAQPFDTNLFDPYVPPGTVLHVFESGDFVVKTGTDSLLVTEYEPQWLVVPGEVLHASDYQYQNPYQFPVAHQP